MPSMVLWGFAFTISLVVMLLTAGARMPMVHLAMAALITLGIAFVAILENKSMRDSGTSKPLVAAATARNMGFIYIWGAVVIAITYLSLLSWHEWWHWFIGFALVGTMCIFYSNTLTRDAEAGRQDNTMLSIGNKLTWVQLIGMLIAIVGMLVDGKLTRFVNPKLMDWAAQNTFFAGAVGLAIVSAYALWAGKNDKSA